MAVQDIHIPRRVGGESYGIYLIGADHPPEEEVESLACTATSGRWDQVPRLSSAQMVNSLVKQASSASWCL